MLKQFIVNLIRAREMFFKWHIRFRDSREVVNDNERQDALVTKQTDENVMKIRELL
jgi:hypothetical protein